MRTFRFIYLAAIALLCTHEKGIVGGDPGKGPSAQRINCLNTFNKERAAVGFPNFKAETETNKMLPVKNEGDEGAHLKAICDAIVDHENPKAILYEQQEQRWTFGYAPETTEDPDCTRAVSYWKQAISNFSSLPPEYQSDANKPYDWFENRSLVALFNPQQHPKVDCAFYTCPYNHTGDSPSQANLTSSVSANSILKGECKYNKTCLKNKAGGVIKSMVCLTFPPPLVKGQRPFTQEQWDKITLHISSGKMYSVTAITSFLLAASALFVSTS